ncbi:conjugal transfer protein TraD [Parasphingorhabdus cellanae]|uniref:Conjugal transfer protein TraD n=1 Tax=Parasphingorhabdus cellanae TaxID=2806553 RepID=A0ABX7SZX1_9SPHN|nr:conjugal transfer protein TraD [Parasphingorhabdus cellanae]QTD54841.1 conjugal transfer protein TraD [Parasphingorhabdus cellanae]
MRDRHVSHRSGNPAASRTDLFYSVFITRADKLDADMLAGVLLAAAQSKDTGRQEAWRRKRRVRFLQPLPQGGS